MTITDQQHYDLIIQALDVYALTAPRLEPYWESRQKAVKAAKAWVDEWKRTLEAEEEESP